VNVNGHVSGFALNSGGGTSDFVVRADKFLVAMPGQTARVVFGVDARGALLNGDLHINNGKVIWSNGVSQKVAGVGFGTSSQFIEWFGPVMALNLCSESNAVCYLKTNGDAYFGGVLNVGVLKNSAQTTLIAPTAEVVVGPFGSNGGSRVVTLNYSYEKGVSISNAASWTGTPTATVLLERWTGSAWATVGTLNATGSVYGENGTGVSEPGIVAVTMGGSITVTDTAGGTNNIQFRGRITSRTDITVTSTVIGTDYERQGIGVLSVEG
jgi:hypothetical protein